MELELILPPGFPEKYRTAVTHAALGCRVKKTLANPPEFVVTTTSPPEPGADGRDQLTRANATT